MRAPDALRSGSCRRGLRVALTGALLAPMSTLEASALAFLAAALARG
jgi:hypothetical protein